MTSQSAGVRKGVQLFLGGQSSFETLTRLLRKMCAYSKAVSGSVHAPTYLSDTVLIFLYSAIFFRQLLVCGTNSK